MRVMISCGLLRWKLEMHMTVKNTLYLFILSPIIPYPLSILDVGGWEQIPLHVSPHHPETPQAIKLKAL